MKKWWRIGLLALLVFLMGCTSATKDMNSEEQLTESAYLEKTAKNTEEVANEEIILYYTNPTATSLYKEEKGYDFSEKSSEEIVWTILHDLETAEGLEDKSLKESSLQSIFPLGVLDEIVVRSEEKVKMAEEEGSTCNIVELHMTKLYHEMSLNEMVVLRTGVSRSIFSAGIIDQIEFWAPISKEGGGEKLMDTLSADDKVIINQYSRDFYTDDINVTLYFGNADKTALKAETRTLTLTMTDPLPTAIMKALLAGPVEEGMTSVIPQGTMIEDVFIKDSVCYVDLSAEFQKNHLGGELEETLTIYSIVNSLQDISGIHYVQFLVEGRKLEYYKSYMKIDTFLTGDMTLVE